MDETLAAGETFPPCAEAGESAAEPLWGGTGAPPALAGPGGVPVLWDVQILQDLGSVWARFHHRNGFFWDELRVSMLVATVLLM